MLQQRDTNRNISFIEEANKRKGFISQQIVKQSEKQSRNDSKQVGSITARASRGFLTTR